jgi:predicted PP-loop superfamily ATPase
VRIGKIRKVEINMLTRKQLDEFFSRLEGEEGCDFKKDENEKITWKCKGGTDKSKAFEILRKMKISEKEIAGFISLCEQYGGYCDCEILFNAEEHINA